MVSLSAAEIWLFSLGYDFLFAEDLDMFSLFSCCLSR